MTSQHAGEVAALHISGIESGFLSRLGPNLLADLYRAINDSTMGFVFVALDETDQVLGYVSGTTSVRLLYRSVLLRRGWRYVGTAARHMFHWRTIRGMVESVIYPVKTGRGYPEGEWLSIVVREDARGTGLATELLFALLEEFRQRGCRRMKLVVNVELARANAFYLKHGFEPAGTIRHHGRRSNVLVIDTARAD